MEVYCYMVNKLKEDKQIPKTKIIFFCKIARVNNGIKITLPYFHIKILIIFFKNKILLNII